MADGVKKINEFIMKNGRVIGITTPDYPADRLEPGTLYINPGDGKLKYVNAISGNKQWRYFDPNIIFEDGSIVTRLLRDKCVTTEKINDKAVTAIKIGDKQVTTIKYADLSVTNGVIGNDAVDRKKIKDLEVITSKIANLGVTTEKINNASVTDEKIKHLNVFNKHISNRTIEATKLVEKTLTRNEIRNLEIVNELIGNRSITENKIQDNAVVERTILNESVTFRKIGNRAVYGDKIKDVGVEDRHVKEMNGTKLFRESVANDKLTSNSVSTVKIQDLAVTMNKIDAPTQTLIRDAIRVKSTQVIGGHNVANTALCAGHMRIRANSGQANLKIDGNVVADGNITGAKVYNPVFADIAEAYTSNEKLEAGDPICLCKNGGLKVEKLNKDNSKLFFGFVSNEYAMCFGATPEEIASKEKYPITLTGRITVSKDLFNRGDKLTVGDWFIVHNGEFIGVNCKVDSAIGRVIDIKEDTVLVKI